MAGTPKRLLVNPGANHGGGGACPPAKTHVPKGLGLLVDVVVDICGPNIVPGAGAGVPKD